MENSTFASPGILTVISYIVYLVSSVLFIFGIRKLSSPKTARQGNFLASLGMFLAILVTVILTKLVNW